VVFAGYLRTDTLQPNKELKNDRVEWICFDPTTLGANELMSHLVVSPSKQLQFESLDRPADISTAEKQFQSTFYEAVNECRSGNSQRDMRVLQNVRNPL